MMTRLGQLTIDKQHSFAEAINGLAISPLLQDICLRFAQCEIYARSAALLAEGLNLPSIYATQLHRLVESHGPAVATQLQQLLPELESIQPDAAQPDAAQPDAICAQADGSMIRCQQGWREVKVSRIFPLSACQPSPVPNRGGQLTRSTYSAYLGKAEGFKPHFSRQLNHCQTYCQAHQLKLLFLSDGIPWLRQYMTDQHPDAELVLDFYHVMEHLGRVAEAGIGCPKKRQEWLEDQKKLLKDSQLDQVLASVRELPSGADCQQTVVAYLESNADRMDYRRYMSLGWPIGSGAVEAAHRVVVQSRLKRSGQYWSEAGAQRVLNLRVLAESDRWDLVQALLRPGEASYAMAA